MTNGDATGIVRIAAAGDAALLVEFPSRIDPAVNARALALAAALRARWEVIIRDVVVGYSTVTVYFDPLRVDARWLEAELRTAAEETADVPAGGGALVELPVCYDGDFAPDLQAVAAFGGMSPEEVIALHTERTYRVYMIGFVPGFAYLAEVDPRIAAPRRTVPRTEVPAGSVAVAGGQTGIYPAVTPGGWNVIGRTPVKPYDASRNEPCLLRPGDHVRFVPITRDAFNQAC